MTLCVTTNHLFHCAKLGITARIASVALNRSGEVLSPACIVHLGLCTSSRRYIMRLAFHKIMQGPREVT